MTWHIETISELTLGDFVMITKEMFDLSGVHHLGFDRMATIRLGRRFIEHPVFFCQLAYEDDECVGFMAGYLLQLVFSNNFIGNEEGIYVRAGVKERAAIASEMLKRFVRFAFDAGAVDVRTGVIAGIDNYAADVFYRRNGFKRIGTIYALREPGGK